MNNPGFRQYFITRLGAFGDPRREVAASYATFANRDHARTARNDPTHAKLHDLPLYLDECNHSPTGFEFGYNGSGPSQLAYAICRQELGDRIRAELVYQEFKRRVVALQTKRTWSTDSDEIIKVVWQIEKERLPDGEDLDIGDMVLDTEEMVIELLSEEN